MASNAIKGLTIKIGADTTGLDTALKTLEKGSKKTKDELKEVGKALKTAPESVTLWEQKQKLLTTALEDSRKKLKLLEEAQEQVNEKFRKGEIGEEAYRAFQRETEYARSEVERYGRQLEQAETKVKEFASASDGAADDTKELAEETAEAGKQAEKSSDGFTVMKGALADLAADGIRKAAGALKDFTVDVIQTGSQFEAQMSGVGAISGASAEEMELLNEKAKEMGATTKFTAAQSGEAFEYMAMAGWKTEEMLSGIDGILALAAASGEDLGTTSDIVTDALTAFGLTAGDAGHFADVLAAASSNANTNVSMMGETFKYVAPIAGSLGYSAEDVATAIGIMANSGIKASQAGTALRTIMSNLTGDFKIQGDAIGEVTVKTQNADGSMRDFSEILSDTRAAFDGLTESEKAQQAETLVGKNAMSGFLALVNAAPGDVSKLTEAITNCDGAAQGMSETMVDNLQGDMTLLDSAVDGMKIGLSEELTPVLRDTVQYVTKQMPAIKETLTPIFKTGAEGVSFLVKNIPTAVSMLKTATPVIAGVGAAFGAWKIEETIDKTKKLAKAFDLVTSSSIILPVAVASVAASLISGGMSYIAAVEDARQAHLEEVFADATAKTDELTGKIYGNIDAMNAQKNAAAEKIEADELEMQKIQSLRDELDKLVDKNGVVKQGYEDRAKFITGELSEATGIEIEYIDGQIQKYDELKTKIDEVIEKKRAESMAGAYESVVQTAEQQNKEAIENLKSLDEDIRHNQYEIDKLYRDAKQEAEDRHISYGDFGEFSYSNIMKMQMDNRDTWSSLLSETQLEKLYAYEQNIRSAQNAQEALHDSFAQNQSDIEEYDRALTELYSGNYKKAQEYFNNIGNLDLAALRKAKDNIGEQKKAFSDGVKNAVDNYNAALRLGDKNAKKTFTETIATLSTQGREGGMTIGDLLSTGIVQQLDNIDGFDDSGLQEFAKICGWNFGDNFGTEAAEASARAFLTAEGISEKVNGAFSRLSGLPFFATGGFLGIGHEGIVAEAGPELLEVMNGGVRITPLTGEARNTPVQTSPGGAGGTTRIYNNYVSATIKGSYDVYKLAEDMSTAERIMDNAKGV